MGKQKKAKSEQLLAPLEALDAKTLKDLGDGEEFDHTPIIITDGSAKIDLSSEQYKPISGVYTSFGLHLDEIECLHATHSNGNKVCYTVKAGELCIVVFHCTRGGLPNENFVIQGGLTTSPTVIFSHTEYPKDTTAPAERFVHSNVNRKIVAMEIFRLRGGERERVHVCPLIPTGGGCRYQIWDRHIHSHII